MILIFGGNGFVGQHVARQILDSGEEIAVTATSRAAEPILIAEDIAARRARVLEVDVTDSASVHNVVGEVNPSVVIDLTGHAPKVLSPSKDVLFRTSALTNILDASLAYEVDRVVLMSSMDVYWGLPTCQAPYTEEDPVPLIERDDHFIVQSWVKKTLEVIGNLYRRQHGMDIRFVRGSGVYGPLYRTYLNAPSQLIRSVVEKVEPGAGAGGKLYAQAGYDQLYVKDMAAAISLVALANVLEHPVYNIGSGTVPTYAQFASALSLTLPDRPSHEPPGFMDGRWMDTTRAREELGFAPKYSVEAAMADYLSWVDQHGL